MNRFNIPDLNPMYGSVRKYIEENQGTKGFILTEPQGIKDTISTIVFESEFFEVCYEAVVKAIRVKNNRIEIIYSQSDTLPYKESDIKELDEDSWEDIKSPKIEYISTLFNIAENIEQYTE